MNSLDQFMKGIFKKIEPWVQLAFFVMVAIGGSIGISARRVQTILGGGALYTFVLVIYWLVMICALACVVLKIIHAFASKTPSAPANNFNQGYVPQNGGFNPQQNMNGNFGAPVQNSMPVQGNPVPQQTAAPEKFCPNCGAKIPQDSAFCTNCGNKA